MSQGLRAVWSRGNGCVELATLIDPDAQRIEGDLTEFIVGHRADVLVSKRFSASFDVIPTLVPFDVSFDRVDSVAALVAGGPHSELAARVAHRLGVTLAVPTRLECAYETDGGQVEALNVVERLVALVPGVEAGILQAGSASEVIEKTGDGTLLVVGAPGGSFLQRQFFGKGARLIAKSSIGAVAVREAPRRVFHGMDEPAYVSPHMGAGDAARLMPGGLIAVVEDGVLIGSVTGTSLLMAGDGPRVVDCMKEPVSLGRLDTVDDGIDRLRTLGVPSLPVVDDNMNLLGTATVASLQTTPFETG
ncbi:MAG: CBS domain-containing protein [Acidimicrobiia bacterium]|nr:CBS domain-containing protein [Acidimicrobiia bacterium]